MREFHDKQLNNSRRRIERRRRENDILFIIKRNIPFIAAVVVVAGLVAAVIAVAVGRQTPPLQLEATPNTGEATEPPLSTPVPTLPADSLELGVTAPPWFDEGDKNVIIREEKEESEITASSPVMGSFGAYAMEMRPYDILFAMGTKKDEVVDGIMRMSNVTLRVDGRTIEISTQPSTVQAVLDLAGVTLGSDDEINYSLSDQARDGAIIQIHRITYKTETEYKTIPYETVYKGTYYLEKGKTQKVSSGKNGERKIVRVTKYRDGVAVEKNVQSDTVTKQVVNCVYEKGLWDGNHSTFTSTGVIAEPKPPAGTYSKVLTARATAYTHTGNNTASGRYPVQGKTVAVAKKFFKTSIVKKYTRLYVEGYGYCIVEDSGDKYMEAYDGYWIDVFLDTESQCRRWGMRDGIKVYILN